MRKRTLQMIQERELHTSALSCHLQSGCWWYSSLTGVDTSVPFLVSLVCSRCFRAFQISFLLLFGRAFAGLLSQDTLAFSIRCVGRRCLCLKCSEAIISCIMFAKLLIDISKNITGSSAPCFQNLFPCTGIWSCFLEVDLLVVTFRCYAMSLQGRAPSGCAPWAGEGVVVPPFAHVHPIPHICWGGWRAVLWGRGMAQK